MQTIDLDRSYLDMLRAELRQYEAQRAQAAEHLKDDGEYLTKVLAGWDYVIGRHQAQIKRLEEAEATP